MRRRNFIALLGGVIALPFVARAQQSAKVHRIAVVHPSNPVTVLTKAGGLRAFQAFFVELERQGYIEGKSLVVERYSGGGKPEKYAELAREVVRTNPDLIVCVTTRMMGHLKLATATTPIVGVVADPISAGIIPSLARPGGNITGVTTDAGLEIWSKRLELLREAIPTASRIAFLTPRRLWEGAEFPALMHAVREAARRVGVTLLGAPVDDPLGEEQFRQAFAAMIDGHADAILAGDSAEIFTNRRVIVELARQSRLPAIYTFREHVEIGGFMAYAFDLPEIYRHLAVQISQILKGANPGDIPFYRVTKFDLVINLKTADALGVTFPPSLLVFANEVIE